jgi:beta-alanine--pyruvate transaminase
MAGSTGVLVPPKGYLERLRKICDKHGILLIFDEVITGFGRLGTDFAASYFGVIPDLMTVAKGITNATVPMGAVFARKHVYDTIVNNAPPDTIELFHGYTYSAHPLACAAGLATWQLYKDEGLFAKAKANAPYLEAAVHSLKGLPHVIDIRNIGMVGAIELEPRPGKPGGRGYDALVGCFEKGLLTRITGDIIAVSPPLIAERSDIDKIPEILGAVLKTIP